MNVLCEMKKMFNVDTMNISERNTVVEISFNLSKATLPDKETFSAVFALIPIRDTMKIALNTDLSYKLDGMTGAIMNGGIESSVVNNYYNNDNSRTVNQTNNSPKSLSRLEIYRQTKNAVKM